MLHFLALCLRPTCPKLLGYDEGSHALVVRSNDHQSRLGSERCQERPLPKGLASALPNRPTLSATDLDKDTTENRRLRKRRFAE